MSEIRDFYKKHKTQIIVATYIATFAMGMVIYRSMNPKDANPVVKVGILKSDNGAIGTAQMYKNGDILLTEITQPI